MLFINTDLQECLNALNLEFDEHKELVKLVKNNSFSGFASTVVFHLKGVNQKETAQQIAAWLLKHKKAHYRRVFVANNNFINFEISPQKYLDFLKTKPTFAPKPTKVLIEWVSANPTGELHLGHVRNAFFGHVLNNLMVFLGFQTVREYWVNDYGQQARVFGFSVYQALHLQQNIKVTPHPDGYEGELVDSIAKTITGIPLDKLSFEEFLQQPFLDQLLADCTAKVLEVIKQDLATIHIHFDSWKFESQVVKETDYKKLLTQFKDEAHYEKDGAIWLKTTLYGDDKDRVLVRQDNRPSYFGTDVAYHLDKAARGFDLLYDIWGSDHEGHIKRMHCVYEGLKIHQKCQLKITALQLVMLYKNKEIVRLSKRAGNVITIKQMLQMLSEDAARWFMLSQTNNSIIKIDLDTANLQNSSNPVYYVQYAYARMCSVLKVVDQAALAQVNDCSLLTHEKEIVLLDQLVYFKSLLEKVQVSHELHLLTNYLYETATLFHSWYKACKINDPAQYNLTQQRLLLLQSLHHVFGQLLQILNITAPQQM
ncbi:arginine--tRNA ligase [Mycoplasmoides pneumoniae]|uniref:arginine--tRNA ligase n=1 Tax=Mycoplasmoides pneumoniae TaxID=2104 RepID=UPI00132F7598|nr:arginine--tRNA ligase [Mycoplasmoides pneumoniae]